MNEENVSYCFHKEIIAYEFIITLQNQYEYFKSSYNIVYERERYVIAVEAGYPLNCKINDSS